MKYNRYIYITSSYWKGTFLTVAYHIYMISYTQVSNSNCGELQDSKKQQVFLVSPLPGTPFTNMD